MHWMRCWRKKGREKSMEFIHLLPEEIEKTSFAIIEEELAERGIRVEEDKKPVLYRVIHTTADLEYVDTMTFSDQALEKAKEAIKRGAHIITDTQMAYAGINKRRLADFGGEVHCYMADEDVAKEAKERRQTRAMVSMEKALRRKGELIFAIGNAPTALLRLKEAVDQGARPALIIGVPVGFVNVTAAKELILQTKIPYIVNRGRKGGSNVAAAICNALLYSI